jgi:hypothetical protein
MVKVCYCWNNKIVVRKYDESNIEDFKNNFVFHREQNIYPCDYNKRIEKMIRIFEIEKDVIQFIISEEQIHKFTKINSLFKGLIFVNNDADIEGLDTTLKIRNYLDANNQKFYLRKPKDYNYI